MAGKVPGRGVQGFTLMEMSLVLAIIAVILASGMTLFTTSLQKQQLQETQTKLQAIQQALLSYRLAFNRIPCPADVTLPTTNANFGIEAATPGACTGGVPAANFVGAANPTPVEGMVPAKTLRLPDDYAIDGWGRRIMYAVTVDLTQNSAFTLIPANDPTVRMTVENASDVAKTTQAAYVAISFGPNGHGAYPRASGQALNIATSRINYGSGNIDEEQNCDCNNATVATGLNGIFVQKPATQNPANVLDTFDDMVVYATRSDLRSPTE